MLLPIDLGPNSIEGTGFGVPGVARGTRCLVGYRSASSATVRRIADDSPKNRKQQPSLRCSCLRLCRRV